MLTSLMSPSRTIRLPSLLITSWRSPSSEPTVASVTVRYMRWLVKSQPSLLRKLVRASAALMVSGTMCSALITSGRSVIRYSFRRPPMVRTSLTPCTCAR